ncbi:hypothetical protein CHLRE_02g143900v5 [Chlamydomonas reinhardtii]|uniref:GDSL esterase/lipase n=1 Tax=Chlamydomonas reinhardtii TaxID=3055 RepID=A0A2K3E3Z8_CHLRE|nr:uncharacterized protein CHLRE_02g143900v5 [Chlamydomonas reinhardtii]PNW87493.1 hypothetical protein CHLRE_02g143900v5 [Chlamydomonas reinhardtii]
MAHNASLRSACAVLLVLLAAAGAAAAREFGPKAAATNGGGGAAVVLEVFEDSLPDTGNTGRRQLTGSRHPPLRAIIPPPGKNVPRVRRAPPPHRHPPASGGGLKRPPPAAASGGDTRERIDLVVFGDSLSDTGNTFRAVGVPQADLYYQGRYSNGPIWVDYLAAAVANTTQLTVLNYAHGGAAACPENSVATQIRFIRDLPAQTSAFIANISSAPQQQSQQGGGGGRRLLPINFIGNNDVRNVLSAGISGGVYPTEQSIGALALAITSCRLTWAKQLLAAGEAVWGQQRGPERVLVLLPLARLDLTPSVPKELKPTLKAVTDAINNFLTAAVAALNAELAAAPVDSGSRGARLLVLPDFTGVVAATVTPPFTNFDEACFFHPAYVLDVVPGIVPCTDPDTHVFYDQLHPTTRLQKAFALSGVLPALQQAGLLPAAA